MSDPALACEESAEVRFPADLRLIAVALERMKTWLSGRGLRPNAWNEIELAVAEALNNAVEHGCGEDAAQTVHLCWTWEGSLFSVVIRDPSHFEPTPGAAALPEDPFSEGGRGAFLMAQLMDSVEHRQDPEGHVLRMTKRVGPSSWRPEESAEMDAVIESMAEELSRSYEDLSAVFRFAEELGTSASLGEFLGRAFGRLLELVGGETAYLRLRSREHEGLDFVRAHGGSLAWLPPRLALTAPATETHVYQTRQAATVESCAALPAVDPLHAHSGSAFVCPIFFQSDTLGCLVVMRAQGHRYFSAGELGLIRVVADFLGIACTTSSLQEQRHAQQRALRELQIAASIQQSLLPRSFPNVPPYHVHGVCHSATQVGGDYFDALAVQDGILLVIADVMGKGVPAALLASIFRTAVHARLELASCPERLLTEVNRQISPDLARNDMFITAQVAWLSCHEHKVLLANAGHCPMLHRCRDDGCVVSVQGDGIPLGVLDDVAYESVEHRFRARDRLIMLTDGLYEVENPQKQMLGMDALGRQMALLSDRPPAAFCNAVLEWVRAYSGTSAASDDRTLLVVERLDP